MLDINGALYVPGFLDGAALRRLAEAIAAILAEAPAFTPRMPRTGKAFSVRMTNCGSLGWVSDVTGYRYQNGHPETGRPWPAIPSMLLDAWAALADWPGPPEACLINLYGTGARMGLHQDRDEAALDAPVVSLSLGDSAVFRVGGQKRGDPSRSVTLHSGDAIVLGGAARLAFHGIDRVLAGSSRLLPEGGRINLTLRRVTPLRPA
ncbi:alpha-ketoglutarate-dependent dioxygenase AlkB [Segnochrobactrum spirostomi]|uniref:Alpha-ketoglutarate-dependent dioxygenase AlkB n=1 Tax=Segnochrobactrum spirostomi TaxID=2608987 RepID=A0A6A7Y2L2_9HYPH|nr:alpha-ketoglutarate-dependent dioxygenase AlkB [Segnochrobactrum spirostomi]MQT12607.1 alpha-ketoglutarate-dependent dioxygenase AlkB [Segnochrobactrum spirostomi]